jgi:hypothetical protein
MKAFETLKKILTSTPIIWPPNWGVPFEIMCDASDCAIGAVLGQRIDKIPHVIYYASKTLNDAQLNCSNQIIRRCISEHDQSNIISFCHY